MVTRKFPRRGEIWIVSLDPTIGSELQKTRPVLIVSPDSMNRSLGTVTIMPLTSGSRAAPFRVPLRFAGRNGLLLADQLRTADHQRMHQRVGVAEPASLKAALEALREMFEE